jgi:hypothetical protein
MHGLYVVTACSVTTVAAAADHVQCMYSASHSMCKPR